MIANRLMAVLVDDKKGICRSKTLRETDSRKVSSARFKSLLHDGAELISYCMRSAVAYRDME